jgi:hypothetical protein
VRAIVGLPHLHQNVETPPPLLAEELKVKRAAAQRQGLGLAVGTQGLQSSPEWSATQAHGIIMALFFPHFMDLYDNPVRAVMQATLPQFIGGMWESMWVSALSALYMGLSLLQWAMVKSYSLQTSPPWTLKAKIWELRTASLAL